MLATFVITCQNKLVGNLPFLYTSFCHHHIRSADEYRICKTTSHGRHFCWNIHNDSKVIAENYVQEQDQRCNVEIFSNAIKE